MSNTIDKTQFLLDFKQLLKQSPVTSDDLKNLALTLKKEEEKKIESPLKKLLEEANAILPVTDDGSKERAVTAALNRLEAVGVTTLEDLNKISIGTLLVMPQVSNALITHLIREAHRNAIPFASDSYEYISEGSSFESRKAVQDVCFQEIKDHVTGMDFFRIYFYVDQARNKMRSHYSGDVEMVKKIRLKFNLTAEPVKKAKRVKK